MTRLCPRLCQRPRAAVRHLICAILALLVGLATPLAAAARQAVAAPPNPRDLAAGRALLKTITALTEPGMDGRATGTDGNARARAWILGRLKALQLAPASPGGFEMPFRFESKAGAPMSGVNLVARCDGRKADAPAIVVSAHYDHLGVRNGQTYHGADDNASGVAMLLHVAERCHTTPFEHPLLIAFFDAEEQGLRGARAFVDAPPIDKARLALDVNFDMVSRSDRGEIYVAGPGKWPRLAALLTPVAAGAAVAVRFGHDTGGGQDDWTAQSDHGAFHAAGIPFVYFGVEDHADYHKPTDTADKIAPEFLDGVAAVVVRALEALDRATAYK